MSLHGGALPRRRNSGGGTMKNFKIAAAVFLLLFLTGCSKEALVEKGVNLLDEMFTANLPGDPIPSGEDSPAAAPPAEPPDGSPADPGPRSPRLGAALRKSACLHSGAASGRPLRLRYSQPYRCDVLRAWGELQISSQGHDRELRLYIYL